MNLVHGNFVVVFKNARAHTGTTYDFLSAPTQLLIIDISIARPAFTSTTIAVI